MSSQGLWFPVVFADKCDGCAPSGKPRCVDYCPNGVFLFKNGKAEVADPLSCVFGCRACESLCHSKAIRFPKPPVKTSFLRKDSDLRKTTCSICGKQYWTNRQSNVCMDCAKAK
ncbi:MAG: hypothetical protein NWF05_11780 [Candidatus Bathyarchaeota archaeon]|nr:hypothetical protein [Candidatus Bathyarchaeota archaeon]